MESAPVTPAIATVSPVATLSKDIAWIHGHVIAIVVALVVMAGGIFGGIQVVENLVMRHDEAAAARQQKKEGVDTATTAALMAQLQQEHTDNLQRDAVQTALIQSLMAQMAQQRAVTAKQVATDATLDAKSAASRLATQTKAGPNEITVANDSVTMDLPITRTIVADLDLLSQAQSDVTNLTGQLGAQQILTTDAKTELTTANQVIAADKVELIATIKADNAACNVRVDKQAAKDRKRGFWATAGGVIAGIVLGRKL